MQIATWLLLTLVSLAGAACTSDRTGSDGSAAGVVWFGQLQGDGAPQEGQAKWGAWLGTAWRTDDGKRPNFTAVKFVCPAPGDCHIKEEAKVDSCNTLFDADRRGLAVPDASGQTDAYSTWQATCYAARAVSTATVAQTSFINDFRLDEAGLRGLPAEIGRVIDHRKDKDDEEIRARIQARGGNLGDYIDAATPDASISVSKQSGLTQVSVTSKDGWIQGWSVLAKGDFNGDQLADLLVSTDLRDASTGELYGYFLYVITRDAPGARLKLVREIKIEGNESSESGMLESGSDR